MEAHNLIGFFLMLVISFLGTEASPYNRHQMSSCVGVEDGLYINSESDCKSYTYCHQELAEVFRCLPGTIFSEKQGKCMAAENVHCDAAYRQHVPGREAGGDSDEQIQKDLAMLKQKLEQERSLNAQEEEHKRQIKFRELRDLLDTLKTALDTDGNDDDEGQRPPK